MATRALRAWLWHKSFVAGFCVLWLQGRTESRLAQGLPDLNEVLGQCLHFPRSVKSGSNQHRTWTTCQKYRLRLSYAGRHPDQGVSSRRPIRGPWRLHSKISWLRSLTLIQHTTMTGQSHEIVCQQMLQLHHAKVQPSRGTAAPPQASSNRASNNVLARILPR